MAQAKTLTKTELKRVIDVTNSCSRYAARDVTMLLLTHLCGLRIEEVAKLRIHDVRDTDGTIRTEIRLDAERTKNKHAKTIFVPKQMQRQLKTYLTTAYKQALHGFFLLVKCYLITHHLCQCAYMILKTQNLCLWTSHLVKN